MIVATAEGFHATVGGIPVAIATLLAVTALCACTTISTSHDPLYRAQAHDSEIRVTAQNMQVGIASISIEVTTGAMTDCSEFAVVPGMTTRSIIPCRVGAAVTSNMCTFSGAPAVATCTARVPIQTSTMVTYVASAVATNGQAIKAPEIAYSGGTGQPERIARPVYWHRQLNRVGRIDLGVFPDTDYRTGTPVFVDPYSRFTADLDTILDGAFFNTTDLFANRYTGDRQFFNLWAGPFGANAEGCTRTFTGDARLCLRSWTAARFCIATPSAIAGRSPREAVARDRSMLRPAILRGCWCTRADTSCSVYPTSTREGATSHDAVQQRLHDAGDLPVGGTRGQCDGRSVQSNRVHRFLAHRDRERDDGEPRPDKRFPRRRRALFLEPHLGLL
jgi:hypothetical protein